MLCAVDDGKNRALWKSCHQTTTPSSLQSPHDYYLIVTYNVFNVLNNYVSI